MADIGAKVSRVNIDVNTASDDQLLFNSGWPTMKIAYQGSATIDSRVTQDIVTHNFGYAPMFFIYRVSGTTSEFSSYGSVFNGTVVGFFGSNSTSLRYFDPGFGSGNVTFYYYVFANPLDQSFTAEIKSTDPDVSSIIGQGPLDYGIKVAKSGESAYSTDLRDFAFHSAAMSPNIHMVGYGTPNENATTAPLPAKQFQITHNLGYEPLMLTYVDYGSNSPSFTAGYYYMLGGNGGASYTRTYATSTTCRVEEDYDLVGGVDATATCSIVVLKEPFNTVDGYSITSSY